MVNKEMSLQWKLTFQKTSFRLSVLITIVITLIGVTILSTNYSCGIQHMLILNEIESYEKSLDPEFCENLIEKIDLFNDDCEPTLEILDCG